MSQPRRRTAVRVGRGTVAVRLLGLGVRFRLRSLLACLAIAALTVAVTAWALASGDFTLTLGQVWAALVNDPDAGIARLVVVEWRLPRATAAMVFGGALGAAGMVFQSLTRNPLASPDVIGFSTGAATGALVAITTMGSTYLHITGGALAGGIGAAVIVYVLAWRSGVQGFRLIIVGIGLSSMLSSVNTWLLLRAELEVAISAAAWGAGSLTDVYWDRVVISTAVITVLLGVLATLMPGLQRLELGDDTAKALGTRAEGLRLAAMAVGLALTATVTAVAGPIAFVALAAPQIGRRLARTPGVTLGPSVVTGAFLLAAADHIAQNLLPRPLPVGVVTIVIGGTYLVGLIVTEVRRRR